eukprot:11205960-Lingulodinium_polyedra.AAC.1
MLTPTPTLVKTAAGKPWTYRQLRRCRTPSSLSTSIGHTGQPRKLGVVPRTKARGSLVVFTKGTRVRDVGKASSLSPLTVE